MRDKFIAASLHLLLSAILILGTTGFIVIYFYPGIFRELTDISDLLSILVPVDIILGPILTFIIYKKGKKGLTLDLALIITCQLAALAYGNWNAYISRPGYLVFYHDAFFIAPPTIPQEKAAPDLQVGPFSKPQIVNFALNIPLDQQLALVGESLGSGLPLQFNSQYFAPFNKVDPEHLKKHAMAEDRVRKKNLTDKSRATLDTLSAASQPPAFFPVVYGESTKIIVCDTGTRKLLGTLDIVRQQESQ